MTDDDVPQVECAECSRPAVLLQIRLEESAVCLECAAANAANVMLPAPEERVPRGR